MAEMFSKVQFVHFGGDEAINECYDKKPSIKEFMK
jgi:hexosaminidase